MNVLFELYDKNGGKALTIRIPNLLRLIGAYDNSSIRSVNNQKYIFNSFVENYYHFMLLSLM